MTILGANTYREIMSQPDVWAEALEIFRSQAGALSKFWEANPVDELIFTGCGSTHYLSNTAAAVFQKETGIPARFYPASELVLFPENIYLKGKTSMLVAVSRSGETSETIEALSIFRQRTGGKILSINCDSSSSLAKASDFSLAVDAAQEVSIAQTRSFASMLVVAQAFAGHIGKADSAKLDNLPSTVQRLLSDYEASAKGLGEDKDINRFFFLGSGLLNGIANEAMLKMKEMSLSYSEAFHMLEFRHGPMSMVNANSLVIGLLSENALPHEIAVLKDMKKLGAKILAISEKDISGIFNPDMSVLLNTGAPVWMQPAAYLPVLQLLAYYRSLSNGLDPDKPNNLDAVVKLSPMVSKG